MKNKRFHKLLSLLLGMMLIAAMALLTTGCNGNTKEPVPTKGPEDQTTQLGTGATSFLFTVVDKDKNETYFEIHTDKTIVGEALLELELISGDEGQFGLYVKTVNGITADYDTDGTYWAFYVNGEYAPSGVDTTEIVEGYAYSFRVE